MAHEAAHTTGARLSPRAAAGFALRLCCTMGLCLAVWALAGPRLAEAAAPWIRWVYERIDHQHTVQWLVVSDRAAVRGHDHVFLLEVRPYSAVLVGTRAVATRTDGWARVSVLTAYLWQSVSVALAAALAWPAARTAEWGRRALCLMPLIPLVVAADLPFVLWAQVWSLYAPVFTPGGVQPLLLWADVLQGGGRYVLGLLAAAGAIALGR